MATAISAAPARVELETAADLLERLGNISPERIRLRPPIGTATEKDVLAGLEAADKRLFELVDGALVEKVMGHKESHIAMVLSQHLGNFLDEDDLGVLYGPDGAMRFLPGLVRIPDVSFVSWERLGGEMPTQPILDLVPELAVEVISEGNTPEEMRRKLDECFSTGVQLVWLIYPKTQTAEIYTSPTKKKRVGKEGALNGGTVLPGFSLPLKKLFARVNRKRPS